VPFPRSALGYAHLPLVDFRGAGPTVTVPRWANGSISLPSGHRRSFEDLRPGGTLRTMGPRGTIVELPLGATARLELGPLAATISHTAMDRRLAAHRLGRPNARLVACCASAAALLTVLLVTAAYAIPCLGERLAREAPAPQEARWLTLALAAEAESELEPKPPDLASDPLDESPYSVLTGVRGNGEEGEMGARHAATRGRFGVEGPADNPDPHIARVDAMRPASCLCSTHLLSLEGGLDGDPRAPTAPWGRDDVLGNDASSAKGHLWGEDVADAPGENGLMPDEQGGLGKTIEPAPPRDEGTSAHARIVHTGLRVQGSLGKAVVAQVIGERFGALRGCVLAALERAELLTGTVSIDLEVDATGAVTALDLASARLPEPTTRRCLAQGVAGLSFPPREDGPSSIRYPLVIVPPLR